MRSPRRRTWRRSRPRREELQRTLDECITRAELEDALDGMLRARRTSRANGPELVGMLDSNLYTGRDMAYSAAFEDTVRALIPDMIRAAMARHISPDALSVFVGGFQERSGVDGARRRIA